MAMNGDIVHVRYICRDEEGNIVDDSANSEEPVCFEVSGCQEDFAAYELHTVP